MMAVKVPFIWRQSNPVVVIDKCVGNNALTFVANPIKLTHQQTSENVQPVIVKVPCIPVRIKTRTISKSAIHVGDICVNVEILDNQVLDRNVGCASGQNPIHWNLIGQDSSVGGILQNSTASAVNGYAAQTEDGQARRSRRRNAGPWLGNKTVTLLPRQIDRVSNGAAKMNGVIIGHLQAARLPQFEELLSQANVWASVASAPLMVPEPYCETYQSFAHATEIFDKTMAHKTLMIKHFNVLIRLFKSRFSTINHF